MLSAECERLEAFAVRDERPGPINWKDEAALKFDIDTYGILCDRLGRLFDRLGLKRVARPLSRLSGIIENDPIEAAKAVTGMHLTWMPLFTSGGARLLDNRWFHNLP